VTRAERLARANRELERLAHSGLDAESLFRRSAEIVRTVVPFDGGCWHTLDPATLLITSHWTNLSGDGFPMVLENEYRHDDVAKFADLAGRAVPAAVLTEANAKGSLRYLSYRTRGWGSELRASFDLDGDTWGSVMLLRGRDLPPFAEREAGVVASLGGRIAYALRSAVLLSAATADDTSPDGPALLVLDEHDRLESATIAAAAWLGDLDRAALPPAVLSVAAKARTATGGARVRVRGASGEWLVVQGTLLDGRVVVAVEPARPVEVAPLVVAAYGLTARERDVMREVLHGRSTKEIARRLAVTPYTVQDHLKSIFEKTGTTSRSDLVARLFFEHFEPQLHPSNLG
jgi:DNA-binding CsgD family transcriptional regulator